MRVRILAGLVSVVLTIPASSWAAGAPFGGAGQLAVTDDQPIGGVVGATSFLAPTPAAEISTGSFEFATLSDNGGSGTAFALAPAADYFVINNLSLGASVLVGVLNPAHGSNNQGINETIFGIAPRVGYNLALSDFISFWPKVYFGYVTVSASGNGIGNTSSGSNATALGVFAPFMFEPARHFLFGIGPNASTQLSSNSTSGGNSTGQPKVTQIGVQITFGGWFLGD